MLLNKSNSNTPKYLSSSFQPPHKHTLSNKENSALRENLSPQQPEALLDNLFKKLNYFSNSSASFLKSAEKLSRHVVREPVVEKKLRDYESEKRRMENSLEVIVSYFLGFNGRIKGILEKIAENFEGKNWEEH